MCVLKAGLTVCSKKHGLYIVFLCLSWVPVTKALSSSEKQSSKESEAGIHRSAINSGAVILEVSVGRTLSRNPAWRLSQHLDSLSRAPHCTSCRSWRSLNSHAHGPLDTDNYARHIPVGRVCALRTSRAPLTETELGNMYAGSHVFAPGPCAYGGKSLITVL